MSHSVYKWITGVIVIVFVLLLWRMSYLDAEIVRLGLVVERKESNIGILNIEKWTLKAKVHRLEARDEGWSKFCTQVQVGLKQ